MMATVKPTTDQAPVVLSEEQYARLRQWASGQLQSMPTLPRVGTTPQSIQWVKEELGALLQQAGVVLTSTDQELLEEEITDDVVG